MVWIIPDLKVTVGDLVKIRGERPRGEKMGEKQ